MLGFILSKMQMLLFATGIFVVALLFFSFVSGLELKNVTSSLLQENAALIGEEVLNDSLCSFKKNSVPERLYFAAGTRSMFYDFVFSREKTAGHSKLILSISPHGKKSVLDARTVSFDGEIIFIDPGLIGNYDEPLGQFYIDAHEPEEEIVLYPREGLTASKATTPDSYVALKEVKKGKINLYIIPCSSSYIGNTRDPMPNCIENILRVGCYKLKQTNPENDDFVPSCFDVSNKVIGSDAISSGSLTWEGCKLLRFN